MNDIKKPKRPYEMKIIIGSNSLDDILEALDEIRINIYASKIEQPGGISCGRNMSYSYDVTQTETKDGEEYQKKLKEYLANIKKGA